MDTTEVAAQCGIWASIALWADDNVADQYCCRVDKGIVGDDGNKVFYCIDGHVNVTGDFFVLPTAQVFPFDANISWPKEIAGKTMDTYHRWMEVAVPGTLNGCPAINVPAGFSSKGLPMGPEIIGPRYKDFATLQIAHASEQASRWNLDYRPAVLATEI